MIKHKLKKISNNLEQCFLYFVLKCKIMNNKKIAKYLENILNNNVDSLKPMDKRHKIPKQMIAENEELTLMIKHLTE